MCGRSKQRPCGIPMVSGRAGLIRVRGRGKRRPYGRIHRLVRGGLVL